MRYISDSNWEKVGEETKKALRTNRLVIVEKRTFEDANPVFVIFGSDGELMAGQIKEK